MPLGDKPGLMAHKKTRLGGFFCDWTDPPHGVRQAAGVAHA